VSCGAAMHGHGFGWTIGKGSAADHTGVARKVRRRPAACTPRFLTCLMLHSKALYVRRPWRSPVQKAFMCC